MIDDSLDEAIARLPEQYQPIYGRDEIASARDAELPRTAQILSTIDLVSTELGRPLRILDLGSAQGYYCFLAAERGHHVTGVENLPVNIEVARAISQRHPDLDVDLVEADIVEIGMGAEHGDFDIVLGLSILHHLAHSDGHAAAVALVKHLADVVPFGIFEMALPEEPLYWAASLPEDPRVTLAPFPFMRELAWSHTHLSDIQRPLIFCSSTHALVNGQLHPIVRYSEASHPGAAAIFAGKRRYYDIPDGLVKVAAHFGEFVDDGLLSDIRAEMFREVEVIEALGDTTFEVPKIIEFHDAPTEVVVAKTTFPGTLLSEVLSTLTDADRTAVFEQALHQLMTLEELGWYHTDLRTWNVVWDAATRACRLIDQGSIRQEPTDGAWPHDARYSFLVFANALWTGQTDPLGLDAPRGLDIDLSELPPRVAHTLVNSLLRPESEHFFRDVTNDWTNLADTKQSSPDAPLVLRWASALSAMLGQDYGDRKATTELLTRANRHHKAERDALLREHASLWAERDALWKERAALFDERDRLYAQRDTLYAERHNLYDERQDLYDERQSLYDERQALHEALDTPTPSDRLP